MCQDKIKTKMISWAPSSSNSCKARSYWKNKRRKARISPRRPTKEMEMKKKTKLKKSKSTLQLSTSSTSAKTSTNWSVVSATRATTSSASAGHWWKFLASARTTKSSDTRAEFGGQSSNASVEKRTLIFTVYHFWLQILPFHLLSKFINH